MPEILINFLTNVYPILVMQRAQLRSSGSQSGPQSASVFKKKASTSKESTGKEIHIPHLLDEREHTPPPGFADERRGLSPTGAADEGRASPPPGFAGAQGFDACIILPPAWGVSLRALTDDPILPPGLSIRGPASRTRHSDRIAGICRTVPIKNTGPIHIDLTEDLGSESESETTSGTARGGAATRGSGPAATSGETAATGGGAAARGGGTAARGGGTVGGGVGAAGGGGGVAGRGVGATAKGVGVAARGGGTASGGVGAAGRGVGAARGGAATGGGTAAMKGRDGGNVSLSNQVKGKRIVTSLEKGIEIMESKRKRKERDWKP
ncbi:hypothetical protein FH972_005716 [Carpinus fangiana]|uniref:Uncharacterized protein n=1 Tax=Carpinus fangiana TaxID=176857 RepID=A0A5N6QS04_9ROSI|nr:hypothetical protein FH972_005716 [Carpinus fangiana]